jgi:DNA modification methylase
MSESVSVWTQKGLGAKHADAQIEREHPAPFSFTDVTRLVRLFTKRGMTVLDPFVGVG